MLQIFNINTALLKILEKYPYQKISCVAGKGMSSNKIDGKIQDFIKANPLVRGKSQEEILSIMADCGEITSAELLKISAFKKSGSENSDKGLVLEKRMLSLKLRLSLSLAEKMHRTEQLPKLVLI